MSSADKSTPSSRRRSRPSPPVPLLIICGPTATGKTSLALTIGRTLPAAIISADSRQVYRGMDLGTGKDIPAGALKTNSPLSSNHHPVPMYYAGKTPIWGYDLVDPWQAFSSAQYSLLARKIIRHIRTQNRLPILVGGTGRYIQSLVNQPATYGIPANQRLRASFSTISLPQLQRRLKKLQPAKWRSMNASDRYNPRRLIRAIEIAQYSRNYPHRLKVKSSPRYRTLWIGLTASPAWLKQSITHRVHIRAVPDFTQEIKQLVQQPQWNPVSPAASALGYREWTQFLEGRLNQSAAVSLWITHELQYAKRQLTWFKKNSQIHWFDAADPSLTTQVVAQVKTWYAGAV